LANDLVKAVLAGERLALARVLTQAENDTPAGRAALDDLFPLAGKAHLIGITGAPGTGKSTLVNQIARCFRHPDNGAPPRRVGIIAVDPTSPFTGGAILGDRVRMRDLAGDPGVFIRSMATRGALGGLARATSSIAQVLDAAGYDVILIETVGAGQQEVEIARLAHTTIVVEAPGLGDDIQAIKAGILEIADILLINKADRPGVENTERSLRSILELAHTGRHSSNPCGVNSRSHRLLSGFTMPDQNEGWTPPLLRTIATQAIGIGDVVLSISDHRQYLEDSGEWLQRDHTRLQAELEDRLHATLVDQWNAQLPEGLYNAILARLFDHQCSPNQAIAELLQIKEKA
jgi:LAO/AO transport system kinase